MAENRMEDLIGMLKNQRMLATLVLGAFLAVPAFAQAPTSPAASDTSLRAGAQMINDLVTGNHILYGQGVLDGFGHLSARSDKDPNIFLMSRSVAPGLVKASDIMEYDLDGKPVDRRDRGIFSERFIHSAIYKTYPEVKAIVHSHSSAVIPYSVTKTPLRAIFHMSAFLGLGAPVFEIRKFGGDDTNMLVNNQDFGLALAKTLGNSAVVLMRGHGATVVGDSIKQAVFRAVYTQVNAQVESDALKLGEVNFLNAKEAATFVEYQKNQKQVIERPWELWKQTVKNAN
jgi:HCOMODA/2-hydroxy-3-carboxy-muconic semialdehyde decarboxylase